MVQRRALSLPPRLLLLLVALLPALASAAAPTSADPLAAVAESPSLPRELVARVRASGAELAAGGLAPLAAAAVDARGGGDALARTLASTRAAVLALCGSAAVLERSADDTAPRADEAGDPAPAPPAAAAALLEDAENLAALFHWLAVALDAALAVAPDAPASPTARREGGTWSLADELREARAVLAARLETSSSSPSSSSTSSTSSSSNSGFSCYRWSGYIARSLAARNALSLPFDELVEATSTWSDAELDACGLRHARLAFLATEINERERADDAGGGNDSRDEHLVHGLNLTAFGAVVETCRVGGGNGLAQLVAPGAFELAALKLARLKSHLSAMDAALRSQTAIDGFRCLSDASLAPAMDDEADAPPGTRLATATAILSFLAGAAEDVLVADRGCERARESSSTGAYYPVPVFDRIAQELAQCGVGDAYGRAWLRARYPNGGTAGLASRLDQVAAAVDACSEGSSLNREDVKAARSKTPPLTRVDLDALAATIRHFRSADAAMFGCRRGAYAHSAAGALAHALDGYRAVLASCPAATADSTGSDPTEIVHPEIVHPSSSSYVVIPVTEAAARGEGVKGSQRGFEPGGGAGFVGVVSASCVLGVGGVAFCVARYLQTRRDRSVRGPWRKMDAAGGDLGRPPRVPPSGPGPGGRAPFAFSARRFYRHLQAGSVGDLPLVEDLDRASGVSTESEGNDRVDTPPLRMGNVVDLPSPRTNRRSNSISEPATRPTLASDDLVLRGFAGGISEPKPRHPSRHSTPYHGLRSVGELRVNIPVGAFRETADGRRPTTPPAGASGAAPFFGEKRLTHP